MLRVFRKKHLTPLFVFPVMARWRGAALSVGFGLQGHTNEKEENEMKQTCKRVLNLALCLLLCAALLPGTVWAAETVNSGTCGKNLTWTLDSAGTLVISGTGKMADYRLPSNPPWFENRSSVKTVEIRSGVTSIGDWAFDYCSSLTSVFIPNSVASIGEFAFSRCSSLTSLTIPDSVTSIGSDAFSSCSSLTSVRFSYNVTSIGNNVFARCSSLVSVSLPSSVTSIGESAFYKCSSLTSVSIPDGVTSIGNRAFDSCTNLTSVTVPRSVTSIGGAAFEDTPWILSFGHFAIVNHILLRYNGHETNVVVPSSVTSIGDSAFSDCDSLTSVSIPDSVTGIGDSAFYECSNLTSVTIPSSVTSIGSAAFYRCSSLTSVSIPNSVTSFGLFPFDQTPWNRSQGDFTIVNHILLQCHRNQAKVTIPDNVTGIGHAAFIHCDALTSVTIPNGVTSIGWGAFRNCDSLTKVTIPNSVKSIGDEAFFFCSKLSDVYFIGTEQEWNSIEVSRSTNGRLLDATIHYVIPAPVVVPSPQNLTVNGVSRSVEKYNIDGFNYFKLRDIAFLLNGTSAQFSVEWDAAANAARLVSGQPYTANGSELVIGADRSATAVRSPQIIVINGAVRSDLAAYNLAGNNFFKLRDMGEALGFQVGYDAATNTAVVTTG